MLSPAAMPFQITAQSSRWDTACMFRRWRQNLERARTAFGARPETSHIPEGEWLEQWRAGMDPASAIITHLDRAP